MAIKTQSRKEQVLQKATSLFADRGYAGASMRDVAKEVGMEPSSLYNHYPSKEALLHDVCFTLAYSFIESFEAIQESISNPKQRLRAMISSHIRLIMDNLEAAPVFFHEWKHLSEPGLTEFLKLRKRYESGIRYAIEQGILSGDFKVSDVSFTVRFVFSILNGLPDWYKTTGNVEPEEVGERIADFILHGIAIDHS